MNKPQWGSDAAMLPVGIVLVVIGLVAMCSCTITLSDKGSVSIEFTQGIKIGHETSATQAKSEATTDLQPLVDYIIEVREPTTQPAEE